MAGQFATTPRGVILHATRSTQPYTEREEFDATVRYVRGGAGGLGWNLSVGPNVAAQHMAPDEWGWNSREHSSQFLAIEFAQANLGQAIGDGQINAAVWWLLYVARKRWPNLPLVASAFPEHRELAAGIRDGKSDIGADQRVRARLLAAFATVGD